MNVATQTPISIKNIDAAINNGCPVVLRTPKSDQISLSENFENASAETSPMVKVSSWISKRYKGQSKKIYADISTSDWNDFDQKLSRLLRSHNRPDIYIEYEGRITNIANAMMLIGGKDSLLKDLKDKRPSDVICENDEYVIGFPRIAKKNGGFTLSLPFIDKASPDPDLQFKEIATLQASAYTDRYEYLNN